AHGIVQAHLRGDGRDDLILHSAVHGGTFQRVAQIGRSKKCLDEHREVLADCFAGLPFERHVGQRRGVTFGYRAQLTLPSSSTMNVRISAASDLGASSCFSKTSARSTA